VVFLTRVFGLDGGKNFGVSLFNQNVAVVHGSPSKEMEPWLKQWCC
jgi:hypothetical protein